VLPSRSLDKFASSATHRSARNILLLLWVDRKPPLRLVRNVRNVDKSRVNGSSLGLAAEVRRHGRQSGDFPPEPSATSRRSRLRLLVARRARSSGSVTTVGRGVRFRLMSRRQPTSVVILFVRETHRAAVVTNNRLAGPCGAAARECSRGEPQGWSQAWERRAVATRRAATTLTVPDHLKRVWARDADDRGGPLGKIASSSLEHGEAPRVPFRPHPPPPPLRPFPLFFLSLPAGSRTSRARGR